MRKKSNRGVRGSVLKQKRSRGQVLTARVDAVENRLNKIILQIGRDLSILQERSMLVWELYWALVSVLEESSIIDVEILDAHRKKVRERWEQERKEAAEKKASEEADTPPKSEGDEDDPVQD